MLDIVIGHSGGSDRVLGPGEQDKVISGRLVLNNLYSQGTVVSVPSRQRLPGEDTAFLPDFLRGIHQSIRQQKKIKKLHSKNRTMMPLSILNCHNFNKRHVTL